MYPILFYRLDPCKRDPLYLRKVKARTMAELDRAVAEGLRSISPSDCRGWFKHCGYQVA